MILNYCRRAKLALLFAGFAIALNPHSSRAQLLTGLDEDETPLTKPNAELPRSAIAQKTTNLEISDEPVNLDAENLTHDEATQTVIASGNVFLEQGPRILRADEIKYNLKTDTAIASGHVVLNDENGDIHYADKVKFNDKLKNGFVKGLAVYMADGSRFTAREGRRENGVRTTMDDAAYTPCETCKEHPERPPLWQIRASEVVHDEQEHNIAYQNARFEVEGVPIAWLPYFSHPDGTIKKKSGFLAPSAGFRSELGAFIREDYYWDIAPDQDATLGVMAMTNQSPLLTGEWRQRWDEASLKLDGGITRSSRIDSSAGVSTRQDEEIRGHVLGEGRWDMNEKWRSGFNLAWAADDQYMRQYDFSNKDVLENEIYAERFSGRHYAAGRLLTFQDIRVAERQADQPEVLPEIVANFTGEPGGVPVIGGRWAVDTSFLGLQRSGSEQDMNRLSASANWQRRFVSDYGLLTRVDADVRGDVYNSRDRFIATPGSGLARDVTAARGFGALTMQSSYPLAKMLERAQVTIEPVAAITLAPNIDINEDIPNEDSQDVQIDVSNIFEPDRFPGLDRIEDQSHATYGVRAGLYGFDGSSGEFFLGQSHRFQDDDNPFPEGSGLERQNSDIVGQVSAMLGKRYDLSYRFQLASDTLASQRHEVNAAADWNRFFLSSRYLYANTLAGTDIDESREQLKASAGYYLSKDWRVRLGATEDLGQSPGLRKAHLGLDYFGQCLSWTLMARRNYTDDASGESNAEVIFNIGLKNLGGFMPSGLRGDIDDD